MIDQANFTSVLPEQVRLIPRKPVAEVVLFSGARYHIHEVKRAEAGYVWLQVFPPEDEEIEVAAELIAELESGRSGINTEEVAIAYEAIERVSVAEGPAAKSREIGFRPASQAKRRRKVS